MWRLWTWFDPRQVLIGLFTFLFALAVMIHFVLLSTERYNWFEESNKQAPAAQRSALPPSS